MFNKNRKFLIPSIIFTVISVLLNAFIIYHACLRGSSSSSWSDAISETAASVINSIVPDTITEANMPDFASFIRKAIGHFGLFGLDAIFTTFAVYFSICETNFYKYYWGIAISSSIGIFVAVLTEIIQKFVPGRSGEFTDVLIDISGYLIGMAIIYLIIYLIIRKKKKKEISTD